MRKLQQVVTHISIRKTSKVTFRHLAMLAQTKSNDKMFGTHSVSEVTSLNRWLTDSSGCERGFNPDISMNYIAILEEPDMEAVGRLDGENLAILPTLIRLLRHAIGMYRRPIYDFKQGIARHVADMPQSTLPLHHGHGTWTTIADYSCRTRSISIVNLLRACLDKAKNLDVSTLSTLRVERGRTISTTWQASFVRREAGVEAQRVLSLLWPRFDNSRSNHFNRP